MTVSLYYSNNIDNTVLYYYKGCDNFQRTTIVTSQTITRDRKVLKRGMILPKLKSLKSDI